MSIIRIPLRSRKYPGLYAIIDEQDADLVRQFIWVPNPSRGDNFYAITNTTNGTERDMVLMHRMILQPDPEMAIDHIDGNGLNNRRSNLRIATVQQNTRYAKLRSDNTSGFKGVSIHRSSGLWLTRIRSKGNPEYIAYSRTPEEAARKYDKRAVELFGEFALTNRMLGLLGDCDE